MPTEINCDCGKSYMVPDGREGKSFKCKDCGVTLTIPRKRTAREPQENRKRTARERQENRGRTAREQSSSVYITGPISSS